MISRTVNLQWTTIDDRFNAPSLENPLAGTAVQDETRPITVHSWSVGVQRELPWRLLADVAYVGNTTRNAFAVNAGQSYTNQLNDPDPRLVANPTPSMIDPTTGNVLPTNLIRPNYPGRGAITERVFLDELHRNYNAIQLEVRRRLARGLAWAVNYTGSVTKQYTAYDWYRTSEENEARNSHKNGSRPHNLKVTYNWMIPGLEPAHGRQRHRQRRVRRLAVVGALDLPGRHLCRTFTYNFSGAAPNATTLTGGLGGSRVVIVCDPNLPRSERTFDRQYRTECVRPPGPLTNPADTLYQGTGVGAGQEDARMGLGYINHDMTLLKNFSIGGGRIPAGTRRGVQRVQHHAVSGCEHGRDVRLRDRRADQPGVRLDQRRARQFEPRDPARSPAHVLMRVQGFTGFKGVQDLNLLNLVNLNPDLNLVEPLNLETTLSSTIPGPGRARVLHPAHGVRTT